MRKIIGSGLSARDLDAIWTHRDTGGKHFAKDQLVSPAVDGRRIWPFIGAEDASVLLPYASTVLPFSVSDRDGARHQQLIRFSRNREMPRASLVSYQTIVQLIAATTTDAGLRVQCEIDPNTYPAGVKVTDAEIDAINIHRHDFHGDWNYTIKPQASLRSDSS